MGRRDTALLASPAGPAAVAGTLAAADPGAAASRELHVHGVIATGGRRAAAGK